MDGKEFKNLVSGRTRGPIASALRTVLGVAEIPYCSVVFLRNLLYDRGLFKTHRLPIPIVSVGNMTLGGTGKSPVVAWLGRYFLDRGLRPGLISRGYGRSDTGGGVNDEFLELAFRLPSVPHRQDPDRVAAARTFLTEPIDLLILDDAMQHRRIGRDLELVLLDATEPFGYGHIFPRGMLREPLSGLRRADVVLLSRADLISEQERDRIRRQVLRIAPGTAWAEIAHVPDKLIGPDRREYGLEELRGQKAFAFSGIGNPEAFENSLVRCGVHLTGTATFPDHWSFSKDELVRLEQDALRSGANMLLCTMKDLVKIDGQDLETIPLRALSICIRFLNGEESFQHRLETFISESGNTIP